MENQNNKVVSKEKSNILFWIGMIFLNTLPVINIAPLLVIMFKTKTQMVKEFCVAAIILQAVLILTLIVGMTILKGLILSVL